jgi:hypothetical protein
MGSLFRSPAITNSRHSHVTFVSRMTLVAAKCPIALFNRGQFIVSFSIDSLKNVSLPQSKRRLIAFYTRLKR